VNVATTQLMGNLGCTLSEISWVIAAYSIANGYHSTYVDLVLYQAGAQILLWRVGHHLYHRLHDVRPLDQYLGIGSIPIYTGHRRWCAAGYLTDHSHRDISSRGARQSQRTVWPGCHHGSYTGAHTRRLSGR
jgi:hypothetical protein